MGIPIYKPKEHKEESRQKIPYQHQLEPEDSDAFWSVFPQQLIQHPSNRNQITPISSSSPFRPSNTSVFQSRLRSRLSRRHSMLTSSLMDRRRSSRVHSITDSSSPPPIRTELDRRIQQRITEKEELLEQLKVTVSLLDQFITAREAFGSDSMTLPSFITEDLPAVLESASSLAAMAPSVLSSSQPSEHNDTIHQMVDRLLQIPPYSTRIYNIETEIVSAHRRIRGQLITLGSTVHLPSPPSPQMPSANHNPSISIEYPLHPNNNFEMNEEDSHNPFEF